ncbi:MULTISPECIES: cytochrome c oxidase subunit 3 [Roseivirga]|uniref:Cytochrome oxidase subunit III n=1 Tax=Roseivirga spongicola TaxID=333140 RepID=A0A150XBR7_9BACT|nr:MULTISPECIES: cytochrome c oxidase subunit 3 [Roseivirga]PWL24604.1 MAG: cytochrome oxidase subunit III [Roseivirga sp. XM-24bin3]KYG76175.1 cytochrome oxidase subunit III [Roseivirga spongicola]MBO6494270.1 cytochrome c oxidase subunit 3 [Roseivirga sp.]MBO6659244.1 cytochrome c oxidase subunit 3 [Roseivirga sp.]MBO6908019.1 cytochrome c oxidase subunit 3 [Roseivirga sp.]
MAENYKLVDAPVEQPLSMHPKKFALWLFIVTVVMIFAAFTSAHIVRQADGDWLIYDLPSMLWYTSGIIILSSVFMQWAYIAAKKDKLEQVKLALGITTILGILFLFGQLKAWEQMVDANVYFTGNPAGSFLYIFTGIHALHLISGVIYLIYMLISSLRNKVHSENMLNMEMSSTWWHFLGGLWIYLFIFLLLNH